MQHRGSRIRVRPLMVVRSTRCKPRPAWSTSLPTLMDAAVPSEFWHHRRAWLAHIRSFFGVPAAHGYKLKRHAMAALPTNGETKITPRYDRQPPGLPIRGGQSAASPISSSSACSSVRRSDRGFRRMHGSRMHSQTGANAWLWSVFQLPELSISASSRVLMCSSMVPSGTLSLYRRRRLDSVFPPEWPTSMRTSGGRPSRVDSRHPRFPPEHRLSVVETL